MNLREQNFLFNLLTDHRRHVMPSNNHYNKKLKHFARELRKESTKSEIRLWKNLLQNKQMLGYTFLRQRPIGKYIADFFCKELKLVIELDGLTHHDKAVSEKDAVKEKYLLDNGYSVLRFLDEQVLYDMDNVRRAVENYVLRFEGK